MLQYTFEMPVIDGRDDRCFLQNLTSLINSINMIARSESDIAQKFAPDYVFPAVSHETPHIVPQHFRETGWKRAGREPNASTRLATAHDPVMKELFPH